MKEGNGKTVLVVEDEPGIAAICMRVLSQRRVSSGHCGKWRSCLGDVAKEKL